jgi:hypothetical protein
MSWIEFRWSQSYHGMIWQHLKGCHDRLLSRKFQTVFTTWVHKSRAAEFCTVAPNVFGPSLCNMLLVTLPASVIFRWHLDSWKVCGLLIYSNIILFSTLLFDIASLWGQPHIISPSSCRTAQHLHIISPSSCCTAQHPHISSPPSMQQLTVQRSVSPFSFRTGSLRSRSKNSALRIVSERSPPWPRLPICELTNDRTGWPLEIQIKEAASQSRVIQPPTHTTHPLLQMSWTSC